MNAPPPARSASAQRASSGSEPGEVPSALMPRHAQAAGYGLLGLPLAFVALPVYVHLPHHYAQQHGVALASLGAVLLASRLVDAVADPLLGRMGDALYRRSPSQVFAIAALLAAVMLTGFIALFFPPDLPQLTLLAWAAGALTLSHLSYSGLGLLHQAWAVRQGGDTRSQSRWVGWREGLGLTGVLLAAALPGLAGWGITAATLALALALGLWTWSRLAWPRADLARTGSTAAPVAAPVAAVARPRRGVWAPWTQPLFRRLLAVYLLNGLASAVPATLVLFFVQDRLQAPRSLEPLALALYFGAGALGLPLWLAMLPRWGLARTWLAGMALAIASFAGVTLLGPGDGMLFLGICVASGLALGADLAVPGTLLNRLIDRCGARGVGEGAFLGWWALATKLNLALAAGLALPLLSAAGYRPGEQDAAALQALGLAYGVVPCVLKLMAAGLCWRLLRNEDIACARSTRD